MYIGKIFKRGSDLVVCFSITDSAGTGLTGLTVKFSIYDQSSDRYWDDDAFDSIGSVLNTADEIGYGLYEYVLTSGYALGGTEYRVLTEATVSVAGDTYNAAEYCSVIIDKIDAKLPHSIKKNTAISKFKFVMLSSTGGTPTPGYTITAERKLDADGSWSAMGGSIVDNGYGVYSIDIQAADTNGDTGVWRLTASGSDPTIITFLTEQT